jgi:BolA family transcriptional regulator, general stress-responsive regulator
MTPPSFEISLGPITTEIARRLHARFSPSALKVADESESHRGHGNHVEGLQTHVKVDITAAAFTGLSRIAAVRLVQQEVRDLLDPPIGNGPVHALSVRARS